MITITVQQVDRSEQIEGVIATYVVDEDIIHAALGSVMFRQEEISESNGMKLHWEDADNGVRINPPDDLGFTYWGFETDWDGDADDGGPLVVAIDVRYASAL